MSRAEQRALEAYPKETRDITGFVVDIGHPQYMRDLYIEGYHQAEKDNELTWEDVEKIIKIHTDIYLDFFINDDVCKVDTKEYYQEVLKRFKYFKERKENGTGEG